MRVVNKIYANGIKLLPVPLPWRLSVDHLIRFKKWPDLKSPQTFAEKLLWRSAYDRRPIMAITCDKIAMKDYAVSKSSTVRVPKTIWAGTDLEEIKEIPLSILEKGWVFKPNHGSGHVKVGKGMPSIRKEDISGWWRTYGSLGTSGWGGWAYSQARKLVFLEELIGSGCEDLIDYKFYIFKGECAIVQVITGRAGIKRRYLFDVDWCLLYSAEDPNGIHAPVRPERFPEMLTTACDIGRDFDFMRVDLYYEQGEIWFSELTPYPSTTRNSRPAEINDMLGNKWELPDIR